MKKIITWHVLLSYDADTAYYNAVTESLDFRVLVAEENKKFRVLLLALLIDAGAEEIESYVASTVAFEITLDAEINPIKYFENIISKSLGSNEPFGYMIQATDDTEGQALYHFDPIKSEHIVKFRIDLRQANRVLSLVKKKA